VSLVYDLSGWTRVSGVEDVTDVGFCAPVPPGVGVPDVEAGVAAKREELGVTTEIFSVGFCSSALAFLVACFCSAMAMGDLMSR
jgi:hypothetical protein